MRHLRVSSLITVCTCATISLVPSLMMFLLMSTSSLKNNSRTSEKPRLVGSISASRMELM